MHAVLDLLIDGERGIWHLANAGAVTWKDFACLLALEGGIEVGGVEPCSWRDVWQPALRPAYSVLGSSRGQLLRPLEAAVQAYFADLMIAESQEAAHRASS